MNIPSCGGHGTFGSLGSIYTSPVALMNNDELGWLTSTFGSFHGKKCTIFEEFIFFNVPFSVVVNYRYQRGTWEKNSMVTNTTFRILRNWCGDNLATSTRNQQVGFYQGQIPRILTNPKVTFLGPWISLPCEVLSWNLKSPVRSGQSSICEKWRTPFCFIERYPNYSWNIQKMYKINNKRWNKTSHSCTKDPNLSGPCNHWLAEVLATFGMIFFHGLGEELV